MLTLVNRMSETTHCYFLYHIPPTMTDDQMALPYAWAKNTCVESRFMLKGDSYEMVARKVRTEQSSGLSEALEDAPQSLGR